MMKRSNLQLSKTDMGFFGNTKRVKTEPQTAEAALARIPVVPLNIDLFQHNEIEDPWTKCYSAHKAWGKLENPVKTVPGHHLGLDYLRELANKKGFAAVIPYTMPTTFEHPYHEAHQLVAGGPVIYAHPQSRKKNFAGVVFHPGNSTLTAHIRGEANPHLGFGRQHGHNKLWEWKFVSRIDPTAMAETISMDELPIWIDPKMVELRLSIRKSLNRIVQRKTHTFTNKALKELICYLQEIFAALRIRFPEGAFIKPVENSCSADSGPITTMDSDEKKLAETFAKGIYNSLHQLPDLHSMKSSLMRTILLSASDPIFLIVHDLLFEPKEIIGQAALKIAKTERGKKFEVRVDFLQGKAVSSMMRYVYSEYYPNEKKAAEDFLDQFFQKANYQHRMLCGGADVALGEDGNWHIIEFNLGAESMGLNFGLVWNRYISRFLGRNTALMTILESIFAASLTEQQKFLVGIERTVLNHPYIDDLPEVYRWFRDRYCELFAIHPTLEEARSLLKKLTYLFSVVPFSHQKKIEWLMESTHSYLSRELTKTTHLSNKRLFFMTAHLQTAPSAQKNIISHDNSERQVRP